MTLHTGASRKNSRTALTDRAIGIVRRPSKRIAATVILFVGGLSGGCAEMVAEGHISDRDTSSPVQNVEVLASRDGQAWKKLGTTDGRGAFWILKSTIPANSKIRLKKSGYYPLDMNDSEFVNSRSHLITPTGQASDPFDASTRVGDEGLTFEEPQP
ncbi:MAG: hypothetical protein HUU22_19285 [Phycisphaerae bacterium]|nr:hypothetical protein [Phycisphaerae bacterium]NUQ48163.1 hypothetical protein [Phycisphaerae bacterium]